MHLMDSVEPPGYRQDMTDKWMAWLDTFSAAFRGETGIAHYEVWPELDVILFSMHRGGRWPEAMAASYANIYHAERRWTVPWMAGRWRRKEMRR